MPRVDAQVQPRTRERDGAGFAVDRANRERVKQPMRVKVGKLKLFKVMFLVQCGLVVDALSANNAISIQSFSCSFSLKL
ncbi:hypothetical protein CCACVL1_06071 [Corchorus capsularis]|uniref:Uncharacterized protein n=1 Tax=Corchorus capsularis TaxID=210143 RepID=A0A1R3JHI5_COCAP|nr:hypothetical protein CCACVL1_06071 [Corchorus capsularis]